ncbi:hypothetical protein F2Q70_00044611 [Brassica cretica]|uniref:Uncharacterized protein n=1 Tax=Brassica cretica TaxID=69181 RepID=A0A8S9KKQ3_BRACR|nr:hypothetical protein F2Q70_00044611 [Brassica cretica]
MMTRSYLWSEDMERNRNTFAKVRLDKQAKLGSRRSEAKETNGRDKAHAT